MSDEARKDAILAAAAAISRRDSIRRAAAMALAAGLGVPREAFGATPAATAARLQLKFYRGADDGGTLLGTAELSDATAAYIGSPSGTRTQIKWYDATSTELGTTTVPTMIQDKLQTSLKRSGD